MDETAKTGGENDPDLEAIRKLIETQPRRTPAAVVEIAGAERPSERAATPTPNPETPAPTPKRESRVARLALAALEQVKAFLAQPEAPRRLSLALLVLIVFLRPLAVLGMALVALMVGLITYFSLGPDRVAEMVVAWYRRKKEADPERAEEIRARAARVSQRLGKIVDRLPERWTQGLYLPDFEENKPLPECLTGDPFDRLIPQRELS